MDDKVKELIDRIGAERGFRRLWHKQLAERDTKYMEHFHNLAMHVYRDGALTRKMKEIIAVCVDAVQLYTPGVRIHTRNAIKLGATEQEIIEALEVAAMLGIHYLSIPLPAIVDEFESHEQGKAKADIYEDGNGF